MALNLPAGVQITAPIHPQYESILTFAALELVAKLHRAFEGRRQELLKARVARQARIDAGERPLDAAKRFGRIESQFSAEERAYAWGQLAWQAAVRHQPEALAWYEKAASTALSEEQMAWRVRAALRVHDWGTVRRVIATMPPTQAAQSDWTYWQARGLAASGHADEARVYYLKIAGQPNFYGNLADEELGRSVEVPPRAPSPTAEELAAAATNPGFQRALALIRDTFGPRIMGTMFGAVSMFASLGMALGPGAGGFVFDTWGNYSRLYFGSFVVGLCAVAIALMFRPARYGASGQPLEMKPA